MGMHASHFRFSSNMETFAATMARLDTKSPLRSPQRMRHRPSDSGIFDSSVNGVTPDSPAAEPASPRFLNSTGGILGSPKKRVDVAASRSLKMFHEPDPATPETRGHHPEED